MSVVPPARCRPLTMVTLATTLTLWGPEAGAAHAPSSDEVSQGHLLEGDQRLEHGDYEGAVESYRAAYYELAPEHRLSALGSIPVRNAVRAYDHLWERDGDVGWLDRQRELIDEFLDEVESTPDGRERVGPAVVIELEQALERIEQRLAPPPPEEPAPSPSPSTDPPAPAPVPPTTDTPGLDPLGTGLTIGGTVLLATGLGVGSGWWTVRQQAETNVATTPGYEVGKLRRDQYLAEQKTKARSFLIAGSVVAGVGAALVVTGVVRLVRRRRSAHSLSLRPAIAPGALGAVIGLHF